VRRAYEGICLIERDGVYELHEDGALLARTDHPAMADKLFFKCALEISCGVVERSGNARVRLTADGKRVFGCEGVPSPSEGEVKGDDTSSATADVVPPSSQREGSSEEKPKRKVFKKPTVEEIADYCREKGYTLTDPQAFYDYHESGGWMVGRNKMKDWKAAVRTWEHKEQAYMQEKAEREKRCGRPRKGPELTNPPVSSLDLKQFEQDLKHYRPKFKSTGRGEEV
jgi:hypothetical protein